VSGIPARDRDDRTDAPAFGFDGLAAHGYGSTIREGEVKAVRISPIDVLTGGVGDDRSVGRTEPSCRGLGAEFGSLAQDEDHLTGPSGSLEEAAEEQLLCHRPSSDEPILDRLGCLYRQRQHERMGDREVGREVKDALEALVEWVDDRCGCA
jgi:hypothetical protein